MTSGEKAIWAAAFVHRVEQGKKNVSMCVYLPGNEEMYKDWHEGVIIAAVDHAGYSVKYSRDIASRVRRVFGEDSLVYKLLKEMVE